MNFILKFFSVYFLAVLAVSALPVQYPGESNALLVRSHLPVQYAPANHLYRNVVQSLKTPHTPCAGRVVIKLKHYGTVPPVVIDTVREYFEKGHPLEHIKAEIITLPSK